MSTPAPAPASEKPAEASSSTPQCPICAFIEAGPCKDQHQVWVKCREEAKEAGKDYIEDCQDTFKAFLSCTFENAEYYEPFLEMLAIGQEADETIEELQKTPDAAPESEASAPGTPESAKSS